MMLVTTLVFSLLQLTSGLRCWTCENAKSEWECQKNGYLKTCKNNEEKCQNEIRRGGHGMLITKQCKQRAACSNNFVQNGKTQCNYWPMTSVCRCCCSFRKCNSPGLGCRSLPECESQLGLLRNGNVTCDKGNSLGSRCRFTCRDGYVVRGAGENECGLDGEWRDEMPCCTRDCSRSALDIIVAMDSSSSIGQENWVIMTTMVKAFIRDLGTNPEIKVGVFRYNEQVDMDSQILLKDYDAQDTEGFLEAIDRMDYTGSGTNTGSALEHAQHVMLNEENGRRLNAEDVILVITDGKSRDNVTNVAKQLHSQGTTILVVGIVSSSGSLDFTQLQDMASDEDLILVATRGFEQLDSAFLKQIRDSLCDHCHN